MRNLIVIIVITAVVLGATHIPIASPQSTDFKDYNYTNIFTNSSLFDLKGYVFPARDMDFGISISQTCYNIHKYSPENNTSPCPTYEAIMALFPDTSNQDVSGKFVYKDGWLQRGRAQMESHYAWYAFGNKTLLFIDPDTETKKQLGMITIEARLPDWPISMKVRDNTVMMGSGRYIDNCRNAVIGSENWIYQIGDTMEYLRHDCNEKFTTWNPVKAIHMNYTDHDITTSTLWLHQAFLTWVKENCLGVYDVC